MNDLVAYVPFSMIGESVEDCYSANSEVRKFYEKLEEWIGYAFNFMDRTDTLKHYLNIKNICPLPSLSKADLVYSDICDQRACELVKSNNKITVSWSGGIDSTLVLVSLLKNGAQKDQVHVVLTSRSVSEYPEFFTDTVSKMDYTQVSRHDVRSALKADYQNIIVTGEMNDKFFGVMWCAMARREMNLDVPYTDYLPEDIHEFIHPFLQKCPIPIFTLCDFFSWIKIAGHWQSTLVRYYCGLAPDVQKKITHFFDTNDFQKWAIFSTEEKKSPYKAPAKRYLLEYTKDQNYYDTKTKVPSLYLPPSKNCMIFRSEDGTFLQ